MKIIKKNDIKRAELAMSVMKKPKNESEKEKQKLKGTSSYYQTHY